MYLPASWSSRRDASNELKFDLDRKGHLENLTSGQGLDLTGKGNVAYQSIRIVKLNTSDVFSLLYHVYQRLFSKTPGDLA